MKQNKKLLALLLVLVIAFTSLALVACNKDKVKSPVGTFPRDKAWAHV